MPSEHHTCDPSNPVDVQLRPEEAEALCFLYANQDYGFEPAEVQKHVSIPNDSADDILNRLFEIDMVGKTADGYFHSLDDPGVAQYADSLQDGDEFRWDTGGEEYPDDI